MTPQGPVEGVVDGEVARYLAIPYAPPPTGERRFRPPGSPPPWPGVHDGSRPGPAAPQAGAPGPTDEDCLHVNVTVPASATDGRLRPVVVWIHGGGFTGGSAEAPHTRLDRLVVAADVVGVTVGYRLGALGWLAPAAAGDVTANVGLLDQIAALRWVRDAITGFSGDPHRVTVMGQSAGAMSAAALVAAPAAQGLLHRVILQSGAADVVLTPEEGAEVAEWVLDEAGASAPGDLTRIDTDDLVAAGTAAAARAIRAWGGRGRADRFLAFAPVAGTGSLPIRPLAHVAAGGGVPMIVGANAHECRLTPTGRDAEAVRRWVATIAGVDHRAVLDHYGSRFGDHAAHLDAAVRTDLWYRAPAARLARANLAGGSPTWHYDFRWPSVFGDLGAAHSIEVRFVLDLLDDPDALPFYGTAPPRSVAASLQGAWRSFIRGGVVATDPVWPPSGPDGASLVVDDPPHVGHGVADRAVALWSPLLDAAA